MYCEQLKTLSPLQNFSYLIYSKEKSQVYCNVYCIDPWDARQIIDYLNKKKLKLTHIINTHEHSDHTRGNMELKEYYPQCLVLTSSKALNMIPAGDYAIKENEILQIDTKHELKVLYTPGHTLAHLSLLLYSSVGNAKKAQAIFSGDTFFNAGVGNCYNGGDVEILFDSIQKHYFTLDDDVLVYPGHDYMQKNLNFTLQYENTNARAHALRNFFQEGQISTMGLERDINLFLRLDSQELRSQLNKCDSTINDKSSDKEIFFKLRQLRNHW